MKKKLLKECLKIALEKNNPETHPEWGNYHHFTFIIKDNKIIGFGMNRSIDYGKMKIFGYKNSSKMHSEINAWFKVKSLIKNDPFEIVNIRLNKKDEVKGAAPCNCCMNFLLNLNCVSIFFTTEDGNFAKLIF